MKVNRRSVLLAAVASVVAACAGKTGLGGDARPVTTGGLVIPHLGGPPNPDPDVVPSAVAMVGDSITEGSQPALELVLADIGFIDITINAERSRRIEVGAKVPMPGLDVVAFIAASDPPDVWVIALGTNDAGLYATDEEYESLIDKVLDETDSDTPLVWVSTYRDDQIDGCEQFNGVLRSLLRERGNATVAEWYQQCTRADGDILSDGVHPNDEGILVFADTVRQAIAQLLG